MVRATDLRLNGRDFDPHYRSVGTGMGNINVIHIICKHRVVKSQLNSLDFVANRFMMKLFNTNNMQIIEFCCEQFKFILPSRQIANHVINLLNLTANVPTC